jgi:hypothetical protein
MALHDLSVVAATSACGLKLTFGHVVSRLIDSREVRRLPTVRKLCIPYTFLRLGFSKAYPVRNSMYEIRGHLWGA